MDTYTLYFDGSCGPKNPGGTAAYGFVLLKNGEEKPIETGHGVIGTGEGMTNNRAEFAGLYEGMACFCKHRDGSPTTLQVFGDSNLVIQVMNKHWKPRKDKAYYSTFEMCDGLLREIRRTGAFVTFDWVPREKNTICDDLSKAHQKKV